MTGSDPEFPLPLAGKGYGGGIQAATTCEAVKRHVTALDSSVAI